MSYNPAIHNGMLYLDGGREDLDGSQRIHIHSGDLGDMHTFEIREDGLWKPTTIKLSQSSVHLGEIISVGSAGDELRVKNELGGVNFYAHSKVTGGATEHEAQILNITGSETRWVLQPDNTGEWSGTLFEATFTIPLNLLNNSVYLQTGAIAATSPIQVCVYVGTDDTGVMVYEQYFPASDFPADTEIRLDYMGAVGWTADIDYFIQYISDSTFSLKTNVGVTFPFMAGDVLFKRDDNLLQTQPWVSGVTWDVGDYLIDNRKILVCNTAGEQTGTLVSNVALWDLLGNKANNNYWVKAGNDLSYDDGHVTIGGGNINATGKGTSSNGFVGGLLAGDALTDGFGNVLIGYEAGNVLTTEDMNTFVGFKAGLGATGLTEAIGIGHYSLENADGASRTVAIGREAGKNANGVDCLYLGYEAGEDNDDHDKLFIGNALGTLVEGDFANEWFKVDGKLLATQVNNVPVLEVTASGVTTDTAMKLIVNNLTTGTGFQIYSNSNNNQERALLHIHNDNTSALDTIPLRITQDSSRANSTAIHIDSGDIKLFNDSDLEIDIGNIVMTAGGSIYLADNGKIQVQGGDIEIFDGGKLTITTGFINLGSGNIDTTGNFQMDTGKFHFTDNAGQFVLPRMTTFVRDGMAPTNGMLIYNTTKNKFEVYENNGWIFIA